MTKPELINAILTSTKPLQFDRGARLPLYVWHASDIEVEDDGELVRILIELDHRGIGAFASWSTSDRQKSLARALRMGKLQKKLGIPVNVNANSPIHKFFNGDDRTAHVDASGKLFFDESFGKGSNMGCPFAVDFRYDAIREQMDFFVRAYHENDVPIDFVFADWEIDGPIEWNQAWENSKRCARCRKNIPDIDDFTAFQKTLRTIRSDMQKRCFAEVVLADFPKALVGNYGVYPNDGLRYWIDYYEDKSVPDSIPHKDDQRARYRQWFQEFPLTGYTFAMPVVYTWSWSFKWYDFEDGDYRWFYNMLLTATNAGKNTPRKIPIISFVHHTPIWHPLPPDPSVAPFSTERYKELLWHMLLRGHDGLFLWCTPDETVREIRPLHEVYAASLEFREFLEDGQPVCFDVPTAQGPVVSALRLGERLLVRRTDFGDPATPVSLTLDAKTIPVPSKPGECQVIRTPR